MKRLIATIGLLLAPLPAFAFPDVPSTYEARRAVEYLQSAAILQGYEDGTFRPTGTINRAEWLKILVAANGIEPDPALYQSCFPDVVGEWFAPFVCYALQQGWVQGYPDGTFGPERTVTFVEALKMLVNVRGYPQAPPEESARRGIDPSAWFAPYLTTSLLVDVVSYDQVWGEASVPLQTPLRRGFIAQLLYRALLAEGLVYIPLDMSACATVPSQLEIKTYVDVLMPAKTKIFRQDVYGIDDAGTSCLLGKDINPFARVSSTFDQYFLQPYPGGQPADSWTARVPLVLGRGVVRGGKLGGGGFRPEVFVIDVPQASIRQLPSIFAGLGGSVETDDGRYVVFVGSSGLTLEAVDLWAGTHAVLDAVQSPFTFASSPSGSQSISLLFSGTNVVTYSLYDSSVPSGDGYLLLETRTADIDAALNPTATPVTDPFAPADPLDPLAPPPAQPMQ